MRWKTTFETKHEKEGRGEEERKTNVLPGKKATIHRQQPTTNNMKQEEEGKKKGEQKEKERRSTKRESNPSKNDKGGITFFSL